MRIHEEKIGTLDSSALVGFVARLKLLAIHEVFDVLSPSRLPVEGRPMTVSAIGIDVNDAAVITELVMPSQQATFKESADTDGNGTSYTIEITATLPARADLLSWLDRNQGRRWLAIWVDLTSQPYVAGEPGAGLVLQWQRNLQDRKQVILKLTGRSTHPTWFLESFDINALFEDADFSNDFDFSYSS